VKRSSFAYKVVDIFGDIVGANIPHTKCGFWMHFIIGLVVIPLISIVALGAIVSCLLSFLGAIILPSITLYQIIVTGGLAIVSTKVYYFMGFVILCALGILFGILAIGSICSYFKKKLLNWLYSKNICSKMNYED